MKKPLALLTLAFVFGCATHQAVIPLSSIYRPSGEMIGSSVSVRGFVFFHPEETLLCPERRYASAPFVQLDIAALVSGASAEERRRKADALAARFESKDVIVRGILKVGPYGMIGIPMVYLEVARLEEANQPPEPTSPSVTDRADARSAPAAAVAHL
jgi:hypothetical protein